MMRTMPVILLLLACSATARAQLVNENLLTEMPAGYKVDFQARKNSMLMTEMVPAGETVNNWTEMVTVQIFFGLKTTPDQFRARMEKGWSASCAGSDSRTTSAGTDNGYAAVTWMMSCPLNPATGKPEMTWFKAIQGNDSFYVVQKAFKFTPSRDQTLQWVTYLRKVAVCDSRLSDRLCPATGQ